MYIYGVYFMIEIIMLSFVILGILYLFKLSIKKYNELINKKGD